MSPSSTPLPLTLSPTMPPTPLFGSARVKLGDITIYYEAQGQGESLILLHGALSSANSWKNQIPVFSQQYRVIAFDSRGQGRTTDADVPISYHLMAEDTLRLIDYLEIDSAYIVGWSDGGIIGIDLATHHPERVKALVAYGANTSPDGLQESFIEYLRDSSVSDIAKDYGAEYLGLSSQPEHLPIIIEKIRIMLLTQPNFTAEELAGIRIPTLVIDGDKDDVVRIDHTIVIAKAIPNAELILLPGMGHKAPDTNPAEWNEAVLEFLKDK